MEKEEVVNIFENMGVETYDGVNSHFIPVSKNLHFLSMLALKDLPSDAKILCVGVGTGSDIIDLAKFNKNWTFTGLEPSKSMLSGCIKKIEDEGLSDRCDFFNGYLSDFTSDKKYDAVLCFFVFHFINKDERNKMYLDMNKLLRKGGYLIHAEISFDQNSEEYPFLLENWKALHGFSGATEEKLAQMGEVLKNQLYVLSPEITKKMVTESGFKNHTQFFQSFLIRAWHARKDS